MLNDGKPNTEQAASDGDGCRSESPQHGDTAAAVEFLLSRPFPLTVWSQAIDRATGNEGKRDTHTFLVPDAAAIAKWLDGCQGVANCYYEINPKALDRAGVAPGKRSKEADIAALHSLQVDVDPGAGEIPEQCIARVQQAVAEKLNSDQQPTHVIASGGGVQLVWDLADPLPLDGLREAFQNAKLYNLGLERLLGGDHCHSIEHLMRIPGTVNCPNLKKRNKCPPREYALARRIGGTGEKVHLAALDSIKANQARPENDTRGANVFTAHESYQSIAHDDPRLHPN